MVRLSLLGPIVLAFLTCAKSVAAFGESGAFDPRVLLTHSMKANALGASDAWSKEVIQRTSAPAKRPPTQIRASDPAILSDPFLYWTDRTAVEPLEEREVAMLRKFLALGGLLVIDDASATPDGKDGPFGASVRKELARIVPSGVLVPLKGDHVLFRTFYLLNGAEGKNQRARTVEAIVRGTTASVLFVHSDLGSELAADDLLVSVDRHHEMAMRFAVNIAMYSLCSNYKDDQVHAPIIMRRRGPVSTP